MKYRSLRGMEGGEVYRFTSSLRHDAAMARHIASIVIAHLQELNEIGVVSDAGLKELVKAVIEVSCNPPKEGYEDLWEAIEDYMVKRHRDGLWYPLGRSRNDQVAAALRLYVAHRITVIAGKAARAAVSVLESPAASNPSPIVGFTHGEPAYIIDSRCLAAAYAHTLIILSKLLLDSALHALEESPLGAAAGAGTLAPIDERRLASKLGFRSVYRSPYHAVSYRGFIARASTSLSLLCVEASRIAEDIIQLHHLRLIKLPKGHLATSSIMAHKENPVTLEIVRALSSECVSKSLTPLLILLKQRYSYNLDLQEVNRSFSEIADTAETVVEVMSSILRSLKVDPKAVEGLAGRIKPYSAEEVEYISLSEGKPARLAYAEVARRGVLRRWSPEEVLNLRRTGCNRERSESMVNSLKLEARRVESEALKLTGDLESRLPKCGSSRS